ncbi:UDP-glucosyltransferase family protein [Medicago truncatula]|uniref:UDP-glucosyltransferase family protein n=1 Tax=Medicago truncatula TaxID=3880 RepID=G7KLV3_MEDTR|nr:UDP-glucosyltransferase family protein [Medicago truncatula]
MYRTILVSLAQLIAQMVIEALEALTPNTITDRGLIASWCPQEKLLNHHSIGGFLTHCGWNSTTKNICAGVPMLCWPFFSDQPTNCRLICNELEIGVEIDRNVNRENVENLVNEIMVGEKGNKMRRKATELKKKAEEDTVPGGCSYMNLDKYYRYSLNAKLNRSGVENPWFFFSGSYSGALSAWFRLKFPHLTCECLASSAVVLAVQDFGEFDQQIGESAGPEYDLEIDGDFLYYLAAAAVIAFQYVKEYYIGTFGIAAKIYDQEYLKKTAIIEDTLLMGADYYETDADRGFLAAKGSVPIGIGKNSHIKRAIIDTNARINFLLIQSPPPLPKKPPDRHVSTVINSSSSMMQTGYEQKLKDLTTELADYKFKMEMLMDEHEKLSELVEDYKSRELKFKSTINSLESKLTDNEYERQQYMDESRNLNVQLQHACEFENEIMALKSELNTANTKKERLKASLCLKSDLNYVMIRRPKKQFILLKSLFVSKW